jgi:hypothetical protein
MPLHGERAIQPPTHPESPKVRMIGQRVRMLLASGERYPAVRFAMRASESLLRNPTDAMRRELRDVIFKYLTVHGISYQDKDFEAVDYLQYELAPDLPMFRGPPVPFDALQRGDYFCVIGAAQTMGRLVRRPWPTLLSEDLDLPVLNLGRGGAGPEFFLDPRLIQMANNAKFVVLQVMSGRSVGCEEYPGGNLITQDGEATNVLRKDVLTNLWREDPRNAMRYVRRWNRNYVKFYEQLRACIKRPTMLLWCSEREPSDWKPQMLVKESTRLVWGRFPQLIGQDVYDQLIEIFNENRKYVYGESSEKPLNRLTDEPCPYFGDSGKTFHTEFNYYPSTSAHQEIAGLLSDWATRALQTAKTPAPLDAAA